VAEKRLPVRPADLSAMRVAGEADVGTGRDRGMHEIGIVEKHELEIFGFDGAHGGGDVGIDAAVLVDADKGQARGGRVIVRRLGGVSREFNMVMRARGVKECGFIFEHDARLAGGVRRIGEGGAEFGGVVVAEDEEGAEGGAEGFEQAFDVFERGFPEPGAVAEIAGDDEDMGLEGCERVAPSVEAASPFGDVQVRKMEDVEAVESARQAFAGNVEDINVWCKEHGHAGRLWIDCFQYRRSGTSSRGG